MRPKQFVRAHSMKQEFLIIHTQWVRMSKKKGTVKQEEKQLKPRLLEEVDKRRDKKTMVEVWGV